MYGCACAIHGWAVLKHTALKPPLHRARSRHQHMRCIQHLHATTRLTQHLLLALQDSIKTSQQWFMACGPGAAAGLARMMAVRCVNGLQVGKLGMGSRLILSLDTGILAWLLVMRSLAALEFGRCLLSHCSSPTMLRWTCFSNMLVGHCAGL